MGVEAVTNYSAQSNIFVIDFQYNFRFRYYYFITMQRLARHVSVIKMM